MTWPFGGLPLGGVFLGQAGGPLLQLARPGGPLLITAGVWAGGVVGATVVAGIASRRRHVIGPGLLRPTLVLVGLVVLTAAGTAAPDGGPPVRTLRVALVQGAAGAA